MTKMATMSIHGKNIWKSSRNQMTDDPETWYAALVALALSSLFKWWPLVDLDLFYRKVKFGHFDFYMGKKVKQWIFLILM